MTKRVLLLTYYYYPCTYVAANRPNSFAKELSKYGYEVTVVTRHWTGLEQNWKDMISSNLSELSISTENQIEVHRLPFREAPLLAPGIRSKLKTLIEHYKANLNKEVDYYQFQPYLMKLMREEKFDMILVSIPPLNALRLAYELHTQFSIPFFVDVRDFQNHVLLSKSAQLNIFEKIKYKLSIKHAIKWFKAAKQVLTISPITTSFIHRKSGTPTITVLNGFQVELLDVHETEYDQFHITLIGSVYDNQDFDSLLAGCRLLFEKDFSKEILMQFIGTGTTEKITKKLQAAIPTQNLILKDRMAQRQAQKEAAKSHVLLVQGFTHMLGVPGTKPFEYLALRKPIIQMPGDADIMQRIILECKAGYCPATPEEFVNAVHHCFTQWKQTGKINYDGDIETIKQYSREEQFKLLLPHLDK